MQSEGAGGSEGAIYQEDAKVKANLWRNGAMREYEIVGGPDDVLRYR